jgi:DNA-directed RNA polymerase specialized sigma24 family protein
MENNLAIVERILAKDEKFIGEIYLENKSIFIGYFKNHYNTPEDHLHELYQEAMYIMFRKVKAGGLITSKLSVFLIGIGKNLIKESFRNGEKRGKLIIEDHSNEAEDSDINEIGDQKIDLVIKHVGKLTEPCKSILEYFYWKKLKLPEILKRMKTFKNVDSLKAYKYNCMQRLKTRLSDAFTQAGLI